MAISPVKAQPSIMNRLAIEPETKPIRAARSSFGDPPTVKLFGAFTTRFSMANAAT